jgi:hypothetical protein
MGAALERSACRVLTHSIQSPDTPVQSGDTQRNFAKT